MAALRPLLLRGNPPVLPKKALMDLVVYGRDQVRYFPCDLNADGVDEYFIIDDTGANKAVFVLIDKARNSLLEKPKEEEASSARSDGYIFCDCILVLQSRHEGYADLLSTATVLLASPPQEWMLWQYHGGQYVPKRIEREIAAQPQKEVPGLRAYWDFACYDKHWLEESSRKPRK